jgi:hypothetical protein
MFSNGRIFLSLTAGNDVVATAHLFYGSKFTRSFQHLVARLIYGYSTIITTKGSLRLLGVPDLMRLFVAVNIAPFTLYGFR